MAFRVGGLRRNRGRQWMTIRALVLTEEPLCRPCLAKDRVTASEEVDHIIPLAAGGKDDRANLQGICGDCHKVKHGAMRRVGVDGWPAS
jgi:5-methylcytosine-specific restriction enzyme A